MECYVFSSLSICLSCVVYTCTQTDVWLFGAHVMLYTVYCRWLIEVNASPSLTASSKDDYDLKCRLLDDVLNVIDLENR